MDAIETADPASKTSMPSHRAPRQNNGRMAALGALWSLMRERCADAIGAWWSLASTALPASWQRRLAAPGDGTRISIRDGELLIAYCRKGARTEIGRVDLSQMASKDERLVLPEGPIRLEPPADWVIRRKIAMPSAAGRSLREAVRLDLDRLMPFEPSEVFLSVHRLPDEGDTDFIPTKITLIPRSKIDPILDYLHALGIPPNAVLLSPGSDQDGAGPLILRDLLPPVPLSALYRRHRRCVALLPY